MIIRPLACVCAFILISVGPATAGEMISQISDQSDFAKTFCAASREAPHIFVLPASLFQVGEQWGVTCDDGESTLRVSEPQDDPGHRVYNIDPPHGSKSGLDCDGKADIGMAMVAINCLPADFETAEHEKS